MSETSDNEARHPAMPVVKSGTPMSETTAIEKVSKLEYPLGQYQRTATYFDECLAEDDSLRPHYEKFISELKRIGEPELKRRWENSRRLVHEQGITYNVYGDQRG